MLAIRGGAGTRAVRGTSASPATPCGLMHENEDGKLNPRRRDASTGARTELLSAAVSSLPFEGGLIGVVVTLPNSAPSVATPRYCESAS